tara:strand:+ start:2090 stop:2605 length:516 start_codon:yes stop_codon:yes gene_type:complete
MKGLPRSLANANIMHQAVSKIRLPIDVSINSATVGAAIGWGTVVLAGLPEAHLKVIAAAVSIQFSGPGASADLADTWAGDFGIGTTPATDATITAGDADLIASTALAAATAEVSPVVIAPQGVDLVLDNTAGALEINLNLLIDAADQVDTTTVALQAVGYFELTYVTMLDA